MSNLNWNRGLIVVVLVSTHLFAGRNLQGQEESEPTEFLRTPDYLFPADQNFVEPVNLTCVEFSADGRRLAYGDVAGNVWVRRSGDHKILAAIASDEPIAVTEIAFLDGTPWLAALGVDGNLRIRSADRGDAVQELDAQKLGAAARFIAFAFDSDRSRLLLLSDQSTLETWTVNETETGFEHASSLDLSQSYSMISISKGGRLLLATADGWQIRSLPELKTTLESKLPTGRVTAIGMAPDGTNFMVGFADGKVRWRDAKSGRLLRSWKKHPNEVTDFAFSKTGKTVISSCHRDRVRMWDLSRVEPANDRAVNIPIVRSLALSPLDGRLAIAGDSPALCVIEARNRSPETAALARPQTWNYKAAFAVRMVPDQQQMLVVPKFGTAQKIDAVTFDSIGGVKIVPGKARLTCADISPDGSVSAHAYNSGEIRLFDVKSGTLVLHDQLTSRATWVAFDRTSKRLATISNSPSNLTVMDVATKKKLLEVDLPDVVKLETVCWSPDGQSLVTSASTFRNGRSSGVLSRWSADTGDLIDDFVSPEIVGHLAISPDGKRFATGGITGWVGIYDENLQPLNLFECGGIGGLHAICFLDSERLMVGTYKGSVLMLDVETGDELRRFQSLPRSVGMPIRAIDHDPIRKQVAAVGGYDGQETMRIYSLAP